MVRRNVVMPRRIYQRLVTRPDGSVIKSYEYRPYDSYKPIHWPDTLEGLCEQIGKTIMARARIKIHPVFEPEQGTKAIVEEYSENRHQLVKLTPEEQNEFWKKWNEWEKKNR